MTCGGVTDEAFSSRGAAKELLIIKFPAEEVEVGVKDEIVFFAIPAHGCFNLVLPFIELHCAGNVAFVA
jgi:hypothetical protein